MIDRRMYADVGEGGEARSQERVVADEGKFRLPDRGPAGQLFRILEKPRDRIPGEHDGDGTVPIVKILGAHEVFVFEEP